MHTDPLWRKYSEQYHKYAVGMLESSKRVRELHIRVEDLKIHPSSVEDMTKLLEEFVDLESHVRPGLLTEAAAKMKVLLDDLLATTAATAERTLDALQAQEVMLRAAAEALPQDAEITASLAKTKHDISAIVTRSRQVAMLEVCDQLKDEQFCLDGATAARLLEAKKWLRGQALPADVQASALAAFSVLWKRIDVALAVGCEFAEMDLALAAMGHVADLDGVTSELHADLAVLMSEDKLRRSLDAFTKARERATHTDGDDEWASVREIVHGQQQLVASRSRAQGLTERRPASATRIEQFLDNITAIVAAAQMKQLESLWSAIETNRDTISLLLGSEPSGEFMCAKGLDPALPWEDVANHVDSRILKLHIKELVNARKVLDQDSVGCCV